MGKKSLNRKVAQEFIVNGRSGGKTDQEIYSALTQEYYDKKAIALLITATPTKENKSKYKVYNYILVGLLLLVILFKILFVFNIAFQTRQPWAMLLVFIVPLLTAYFAYQIAKYHAPTYRFCGLMAIVGFLQSFDVNDRGPDVLLSLVVVASIAGLSFFLDAKMFPNYRPNNLQKDDNGEYVIEYKRVSDDQVY